MQTKNIGETTERFGDPKAELLIIGLAPAAHDGNRTGRIFTGDSSGDWLAKVLYKNGFVTKPTSQKINDGFDLTNAYVTAAVKCTSPQKNRLRKKSIPVLIIFPLNYYFKKMLKS